MSIHILAGESKDDANSEDTLYTRNERRGRNSATALCVNLCYTCFLILNLHMAKTEEKRVRLAKPVANHVLLGPETGLEEQKIRDEVAKKEERAGIIESRVFSSLVYLPLTRICKPILFIS